METIDTLAVRVKALEDKAEKNSQDHGQIYARIEATEKGQGIIQADLRNIQTLCNEIKADVKDLKERPAKRWDGLANAIIQWAALAALAAYTAMK
jgi:hypothetical protein